MRETAVGVSISPVDFDNLGLLPNLVSGEKKTRLHLRHKYRPRQHSTALTLRDISPAQVAALSLQEEWLWRGHGMIGLWAVLLGAEL